MAKRKKKMSLNLPSREVLVALLVVVACIASYLGVSYKRVTQVREELTRTISSLQESYSALESRYTSLSSSSVSGSVKEPVWHKDQMAYREVKWKASSKQDVTQSVKQALLEARLQSDSSSASYSYKETITKRSFCDIGLGKGDQDAWGGMVAFKVFGPVGVFASCLVESKEFTHGLVGPKLSF